jgi:voltage-gated potassium channel Kch
MAETINQKRTVGPVTQAATLGAAVAGLIAWLVKIIFDIDMPPEIVGALAVIIPAIGSLVGGYLVRPAKGDHVAK